MRTLWDQWIVDPVNCRKWSTEGGKVERQAVVANAMLENRIVKEVQQLAMRRFRLWSWEWLQQGEGQDQLK